MPTYVYKLPGGEHVEVTMPSAEMMRRQAPDGSIVLTKKEAGRRTRAVRDMAAEHSGFRNTPGAWPMKSTAAGVNPSQVKEAAAYAAKMGVPTDFTSRGEAIFTSRSHRAKFLRAHAMHDRNAGYGDPAPGSYRG